ncbi:MAG: GNAT family N-acetyltransferase [Holophaga sp.]|jgi:predicted N-acyltransferase
MSVDSFKFAMADAIACLNPDHWDRIVAGAARFLSRDYLELLEQNRPDNLSTHYAIVSSGDRPVAAVVAQSLDIRAVALPSRSMPESQPGFWHSVGEASLRSLERARKQVLLYDNLLLWPSHEQGEVGGEGESEELWPEVASDLWHRSRHLFLAAERLAERSMGWVHLRFLVCGSLLATGPHGVAFAAGEDQAKLWPAVIEALARIRKACTGSGAMDMVMFKDLTDDQQVAEPALRRAGFLRFETEPNMILPLNPAWESFEDFTKDLKSSYRHGFRKIQADLAACGIALERCPPRQVAAEAAAIHRLYHQVHERQSLRLTTITERWIPALAEAYPEDFRTIVARPEKGGEILGFVTVIRDGENAYGAHIGFDKAQAARGIPLYLSLVHSGIAQAIELKVSRVILGRTALGPKADLGAKPQPMFGYLRHRSRALNLAVPSVLALLPAPKAPPERHPFRL